MKTAQPDKPDSDRYIESGFRSELTSVLNRYSMENASDTPDYVLAAFLTTCLAAFDSATRERCRWYGTTTRMQPPTPDLRIDPDAPPLGFKLNP